MIGILFRYQHLNQLERPIRMLVCLFGLGLHLPLSVHTAEALNYYSNQSRKGISSNPKLVTKRPVEARDEDDQKMKPRQYFLPQLWRRARTLKTAA